VNVHEAAACEMLIVWPATVTVPLRLEPLLLVAVNVTLPEPLPEMVLAVSQLLVLLTLQPPQVEPAVIVTEALPPPLGNDSDVGDTVNAHDAAACVTVSVWPPMSMVPVRLDEELACTVKPTVALPEPLDVAIVIQLTLLAAVHPQPVPVDTPTE
jgi:hypothetical protein